MSDHYKLSGGVYFIDSMQTSFSGKLLRRWAKEIAVKNFNERKPDIKITIDKSIYQ